MKWGVFTILIILGLIIASWALAQELPKNLGGVEQNLREVGQKTFWNKVNFYLEQAWNEVKLYLQKPINKINDWCKLQLSQVKIEFYKELEEMKDSLIKLLKLGWNKVI